MAMRAPELIPQPAEIRTSGDLFAAGAEIPSERLRRLVSKYHPIFALPTPDGGRLIVVSSFALADELCDPARFDKALGTGVAVLRDLLGDGLFTALTPEPNWGKAHAILMPSFTVRAVQSHLPRMWDITEQMLLKWERLNPGEPIEVPEDTTRLTFDTIGLCAFSYRFNSFYREQPHPFVARMVEALDEAQVAPSRRPGDPGADAGRARLDRAIAEMNGLVDGLIRDRRASGARGAEIHDLLDAALHGVDPRSGEGLSDVNIRYQLITFLIAGHETTSGLLSFSLAALLANPEVTERACDEVDRVLGADVHAPPTIAQMSRLDYIARILKESLRLWPTAPAITRSPLQATILGGRYPVDTRDRIMVTLPALHRDPAIWKDPERFDPDRFSPEAEQRRPTNAYKPFGTGIRSCIGRPFAMQEATLCLAKLLQRFDLVDFERYRLELRQTLTLKPAHLRIQVRPRETRRAPTPALQMVTAPEITSEPVSAPQHGTPLLVLYGSNFGTAEAFARRIADDGAARGFTVTTAPLDEHVNQLPKTGAVVIVTSSYNGNPPDNARRFVEWLSDGSLSAEAFKGVSYTVFGCGHRDWGPTFQAVPRLIDAKLAAHGARRVHDLGQGDARDDLDGMFRGWYSPLWTTLAAELDLDAGTLASSPRGPKYTVEILPEPLPNPFTATFAASPLRIVVNRELQRRDEPTLSARSTRHIEIELPQGASYRAGDHLGIIPHNDLALVDRVLRRFDVARDAQLRIRSRGATTLPTDHPISVVRLFSQYLSLQEIATPTQVSTLVGYTSDPAERAALEALAGEDEASVARYREQVFSRGRSLIDLLEENPTCTPPLGVYLEMLPPLRPRYYSISSSPLVSPHRCSITVSVVDEEARSGRGRYRGVCSGYLGRQPVGGAVYGFVHDPSSPFRPPGDPAVPMIMIGAGTGLAPFRGFLQERAEQKKRGETVGPSLLFFGCRDPRLDFIYQEELESFEAEGITRLRCAFSRVAGQPKTYVQHQLRAHGDEVWRLIEQGAVIYVCGEATRMAPDVRATFAAICSERTATDAKGAEAWLAELTAAGRYRTDVWGTG